MTDTNAALDCSLTADELRDRKAILQTRVKPYLTQSAYAAGTARLTFTKPQVSRELLEHMIALERECCPFFGFQLGETQTHIELIVTGPVGSEDMVRDVFAQPTASGGCCATPSGAAGNKPKTYIAGFIALCALGCAIPPVLVALGLVGVATGIYLGGMMEGAIIAAGLLGIGFVMTRFLKKRQCKVSP